jgi:hypothetical protein
MWDQWSDVMKTILLLFVSAISLCAQPVDATALNGKYHFIQMAILGSDTGRPIETQTIGGDITFDGAGAYQLTAQRGLGPGDTASYEATGAYTVSTTGVIVFTDPANASAKLSARMGADGIILIASYIDADAMRGLFIVVRAPDWQDGPAEAHLAGNYAGASFLLPDGSIDALTTAFVELNADGAGRFSTVAATGQSSNQKNLTTRQAIPPAQYSLRSDGGGSITFADSVTLFGGSVKFSCRLEGRSCSVSRQIGAGGRSWLQCGGRRQLRSLAGAETSGLTNCWPITKSLAPCGWSPHLAVWSRTEPAACASRSASVQTSRGEM